MTTEACPNNPKMPRAYCTCIECSKPPATGVDSRAVEPADHPDFAGGILVASRAAMDQ